MNMLEGGIVAWLMLGRVQRSHWIEDLQVAFASCMLAFERPAIGALAN